MKRTRRIEIVRYSRRVMLVGDAAEADAIATAHGEAAIGILPVGPSETPRAPITSNKPRGRGPDAGTPRRGPRFWFAWLKPK